MTPSHPELRRASSTRTGALLACGVVAGPVFVAVAAIQVLARTGFDLARHPVSALSLGDYGVGFVLAGVFTADPAFGFPPGTPDGMPDSLSWHAVLHGAAAVLAYVSLAAGCGVFARRFAAEGRRGWAGYSIATGVAALVLSMWPDQDGATVRLAVAALLTWGWVMVVALRLRRESADA